MIYIGNDDLCAFVREQRRRLRANALSAARDDGHLVGE